MRICTAIDVGESKLIRKLANQQLINRKKKVNTKQNSEILHIIEMEK